MKKNNQDLRDSMSFLWIAIIFFLLTTDVAFPIVMIIMKVVVCVIGVLFFLLGLATLARFLFGSKKEEEILIESNKK